MAQGKMKVKTKVPSAKTKQGKVAKGPSVQRRGNAPIQPRKKKLMDGHKLKQQIAKTVNEAMEKELRQKALDGKTSLTKKTDK